MSGATGQTLAYIAKASTTAVSDASLVGDLGCQCCVASMYLPVHFTRSGALSGNTVCRLSLLKVQCSRTSQTGDKRGDWWLSWAETSGVRDTRQVDASTDRAMGPATHQVAVKWTVKPLDLDWFFL